MYFQSKVLSKYANIISLFLSSIVKVALILYEAPLIAFAWTVLFDSVVLAFGFVYFYFKNSTFKIQHSKFNKSTAVGLLKDSWPLILSGIVLMIQARIDQIMIHEMLGSKETGYYSAAMRLIEALAFLPELINSSLFPALTNAKITSKKLYENRFLNYYRLSFLLFLFSTIPIFLFAERIVVILFGQEYQPAGLLLSLLSIRLFFTNTGTARGAFINIENLFRFSMITMVIGAIINVVLNYLMIPIYGAMGAIMASIISFMFTVFLIDYIYTKTRQNVKLQLLGMLTFYKLNLRS